MRLFIVLALVVCFAFAATPKGLKFRKPFTKPAPTKTVIKPIKVIPTTVPSVPRPREIQASCAIFADPHVRTSYGSNFDFYDAGDYLFANFDNKVKIIGRTNFSPLWRKRSATTAVMVIVSHQGEEYTISIHASDHSLRINHKTTTLETKKSIENKAAGIAIVRDSSNSYVITVDSIRVQVGIATVRPSFNYINTIIYSSKSAAERVKGLCGKQKLIQKVENAFEHKRTIHKPIPNPKRYSKEEAKKFCAKLPNKMAKHFCEADYIVGGPELAKSSYIVITQKKNFRGFYRLSKKCRQAVRRHEYLKTHRRFAEAAVFEHTVKKECAQKKRSSKCKAFQDEYAAKVAKFNKDAPRLSAAVRASEQGKIREFGERVQLACSRTARQNCKKSRTASVTRIQMEITALQVKVSQLNNELVAASARKCRS